MLQMKAKSYFILFFLNFQTSKPLQDGALLFSGAVKTQAIFGPTMYGLHYFCLFPVNFQASLLSQ